MNKLFTKIAGLSLGLAMAIGVGVAVGSKSQEAAPVHAADGSVSKSASTLATENSWTQSAGSTIGTKFTSFDLDDYITVSFSGTGNTATYWTDVRVYGTKNTSNASVTFTGGSGVTIKTITLTFSTSNSPSFSPSISTGTALTVNSNSQTITMTSGSKNGQLRITNFACTYTASGGTTVNKTITGPSNMNKNVGDSSVDIASQIKVDGNTFSGCTVVSSNTNAVTVSGTTLSFIGAGNSTITISHANVVDGNTTYVYANATFTVTVTVVKNPLPSMVSGDYGKITSSTDLSDGYYLLVCENSSKAYKGSASTLDSNTGASVSISNDSIGSTSAIDAEALYIKANGQTNGYSVVAKVKYADNGYKYIGRTENSNGTDESDSPLANTITFDNDGHVLIDGVGGRRICAYNNTTFRYYSNANTANLYLYKKGNASATFNVTYNGNSETGGSVPTDATDYATGATVTVLGNTGLLVKTGFTWNGWNTSPDGDGTHYATGGTFTISGNTTLYAEWVKSLDAITAIGGTVSATVSKAGTYDWDFSDVTVTGTLSGSTGQDIKSYVDLSSSTAIPSSVGSYTISVTATKKASIPGSATSLTNNAITGEVEAAKLAYSLVLNYTDMTQGLSYANENAHAKQSTATCDGHDDIAIDWASNQVQWPGGQYYMQFQANNGYIYNTTELPGTITNISLNENTGNSGTFSIFYGNSEHPTSGSTVGGKFFTIQIGSSTGKLDSAEITFEVSDKPKVQLVASDMNLDVASGATAPTITDGTSPVAGYELVSGDEYIALITNDKRVQPTGYGKVVVSVSKEEDSGHIYLATSFTVTVGDHSKEASIMEFTEAAGGSATADDDVVWTIDSGSVSENTFSDVYGINFGTNNAKISSLTITTPANEDRIVKNVVIEAMSATTGSTITVSVGGTSFECSKSNSLTGNVSTFNFSGNKSGAITITMSGTASSKYGVKSIAVLYVGDEATSFASTFLGAVACNPSGTSKPTFNFKPDGVTPWTWALLKVEYDNLGDTDKAKFAVGATGVSSTITECVARYDYIVGKYFKTGIDTSFTDFMSRNPSPIGSSRIMLATVTKNSSTTIAIIAISAVSLAAIGGYFLFRKKKEN